MNRNNATRGGAFLLFLLLGVGVYQYSQVGRAAKWVLNGLPVSVSAQCSGGALAIESPAIPLSVSRSSTGYCTKSTGVLVVVDAGVGRLEHIGLLVETAGNNDLTNPRDCQASGWTLDGGTCAHAPVGVDGVSDAGSRFTAVVDGGSALHALTASGGRAMSIFIKRVAGNRPVWVTRNGGGLKLDISANLSSTTWKRIRSDCGDVEAGSGSITQPLDNCIAAAVLGSSTTNPIDGVLLDSAGDVVDIDLMQDEASLYSTSPMAMQVDAGYWRAAERVSGDPTLLPTTQGEVLSDVAVEWVSPKGTANGNWVIDTSHENEAGGNGISQGFEADTSVLFSMVSSTGSGNTSINSAFAAVPSLVGTISDWRINWGNGGGLSWWNGNIVGQADSGIAVPGANTALDVGEERGVAQLDGWVSRVRFRSGPIASFRGSVADIGIFGDNVAACTQQALSGRPTQVLQSLVGGWQSEKYISNTAVPAYTIDDCRNIWIPSVDALKAEKHPHSVLILQCGVNSLGTGAAAVWAKIFDMLEYAKDGGIQSVPATIIPCQTCDPVEIQTINSHIRDWCNDAGIPLADTYSAFALSDGGLNPAYDFGNGTDLNTAGCALETQIWCNAKGCGQ